MGTITLPATLGAKPYATPDGPVSVAASTSISWTWATTVATAPLVSVEKGAGGSLFAVTNDDAAVTSEFDFTISYKA